MENNVNTVTTANYSACSGEQSQPDSTITSQIYSSQALNGIIESNILPTENMEVYVGVSEQNSIAELNSVDGKSAEIVLSVKYCEEFVGNGDLDIENTMVDSHRPNQMTTDTESTSTTDE